MTCYKDKTFCPFRSCSNFNNCSNALTDYVIKKAEKWWGNKSAPVAQFTQKPDCFVVSISEEEF